jgi:hypothetical protein
LYYRQKRTYDTAHELQLTVADAELHRVTEHPKFLANAMLLAT